MIAAEPLIADFVKTLSDLEKKDLPYILTVAQNDTAFDIQNGWREELPRVFDRPTALTLNAVLYRRATKAKPVAEVFIRDEASKGTPPSKYLYPEVAGGPRRPKASEQRLRSAGILGPGEFWVTGRGAPVDAFGNLPGKVLRTIISDLQASFDPSQNTTEASRAKRLKRKKVRGGHYFYNLARRGRLSRGIYERIETGFGSAVRSILIPVNQVSYATRFDAFKLARQIFDRRFPSNLQIALAKSAVTRRP